MVSEAVAFGGRLRPGVFLATGHRGARGVAPENTMPSFERARADGVDVLELDVQASRDGEVVVFHDPTLDRTTDGTGPVVERTWSELAALDAAYRFTLDGGASFPLRGQGVRIPRLSEVLEAWPEQLLTVELKRSPHPELLPAVVRLLRPHAHRVVVGSFDHELLSAFRRACPEVPTSCSAREIQALFLLGRVPLLGALVRTPALAIQMPRTSDHERDEGIVLATPSFVRFLHRRGMAVQVWTINDEPTMRALIALGVDGITTDFPDRLRAVRAGLAATPEPAA